MGTCASNCAAAVRDDYEEEDEYDDGGAAGAHGSACVSGSGRPVSSISLAALAASVSAGQPISWSGLVLNPNRGGSRSCGSAPLSLSLSHSLSASAASAPRAQLKSPSGTGGGNSPSTLLPLPLPLPLALVPPAATGGKWRLQLVEGAGLPWRRSSTDASAHAATGAAHALSVTSLLTPSSSAHSLSPRTRAGSATQSARLFTNASAQSRPSRSLSSGTSGAQASQQHPSQAQSLAPRRGFTLDGQDSSPSCSSSSTSSAADDSEYAEYARRWHAAREAELTTPAPERSLFFGLGAQQEKQQHHQQPTIHERRESAPTVSSSLLPLPTAAASPPQLIRIRSRSDGSGTPSSASTSPTPAAAASHSQLHSPHEPRTSLLQFMRELTVAEAPVSSSSPSSSSPLTPPAPLPFSATDAQPMSELALPAPHFSALSSASMGWSAVYATAPLSLSLTLTPRQLAEMPSGPMLATLSLPPPASSSAPPSRLIPGRERSGSSISSSSHHLAAAAAAAAAVQAQAQAAVNAATQAQAHIQALQFRALNAGAGVGAAFPPHLVKSMADQAHAHDPPHAVQFVRPCRHSPEFAPAISA